MDQMDRLADLFERFPGIGPRQAQRFVQFLLRSSPSMRRELASAIDKVGGVVARCESCMRFHAGETGECSICSDPKRDPSLLVVVSSDADLSAFERAGSFRGMYFVLGGTVSLSSKKEVALRERELTSRVKHLGNTLREVVLAFPANPEGDLTSDHIRELLLPLSFDTEFTITSLGRGLSTGSELEYADSETLKSAFESRR